MLIKRKNHIFTNDNKCSGSVIYILLFLGLVILKFGYYRFSYFPVLDDYIQYGSYHLYDKGYVLFDIGTIYTRPFSAICDMYVWGLFKNNLNYAFIIVTLTHLTSAFLFKRAFSKVDIHLGNLFLIFYLLCPVLTDAVYWLSASVRIVPGLLFCALSLNLLCEYLKQNRFYLWTVAFISHFISYGFYEQTAVLSFVVFIFFSLVHSEKKLRAFLIPFICLSFFAIYYIVFNGYGSLESRMNIDISFSNIFETIKRLFRISTVQSLELTANGFKRGIILLAKKPIYMILVIIISSAFLFLKNLHFKPNSKKFISGAVILTLPLAPYLVLSEAYPEFRSMYTVVMGVGIIIDCISERYRLTKVFCVILTFVFITANISETFDYKTVYDKDQEILFEISQSPTLTNNTVIYVTGAKNFYTTTNSYLGSHIQNITSSSWALTGAVRNYTKNPEIKKLIPIYDNSKNLIPRIDISHIK